MKVGTATTLPAPPGRLLARFATVSDCHIGERWVGPLRRFHDPRPRPPGLAPYPARCARAAIAEAEAWGAELLVAKGDMTQEGEAAEIYEVVELLRVRLGASGGDPRQPRRERVPSMPWRPWRRAGFRSAASPGPGTCPG